MGLRVIHKYLVAAAVAALVASPLPAQTVKAGIDAWQHADYARAVAIWRPLAEKGDADACFNLGQAYRLGRGVPINLGAAQTWFERAAAKGHLDAQTTLGLMLFENRDRVGGVRWLKQAADKGDARALLVYGTALFNGDGVKQDPILGYAYVSRSAALGLAPAQATLEQLDQILPPDQRRKAQAIAMAQVKVPSPTVSQPVPAKPKAPAAKTSASQKPSVKPATVSATSPPPSAVATAGGWRIQLGAFFKRSSAEALFSKLSSNLKGRQPFYVQAGPVTRLQVGPYSTRAEAAAACNGLHGQPCFPVAAK